MAGFRDLIENFQERVSVRLAADLEEQLILSDSQSAYDRKCVLDILSADTHPEVQYNLARHGTNSERVQMINILGDDMQKMALHAAAQYGNAEVHFAIINHLSKLDDVTQREIAHSNDCEVLDALVEKCDGYLSPAAQRLTHGILNL